MPGALDLAHRVAARLGEVSGVVAVALGGSRARGAGGPRSDVDLGLYYEPDLPPSLERLRALAAELDDRHQPDLITPTGAWGPWMDGGGWLIIEGLHVDWLYRDLTRVRAVIAECREGRVRIDYQSGHPHGFVNAIYAGEVHYCRPLHDPAGVLTALKAEVWPYPEALGRGLIKMFLWEAGFALMTGRKGAARGDVAHAAGSLYRCTACLVQTVFALNGRYLINEKGGVRAAAELPLCPDGFAETIESVLAAPGTTAPALLATHDRMAELVHVMELLCRTIIPA